MINKLRTTIFEKIKLISIDNPVVLLDEMINDEIFMIEDILKEFENIKIFIIEKNDKKRIFLKLQNNNLEIQNIDNLEGNIHSLYSKKDYKETLNKLLLVIMNEETPKPCYYRMLGYTYLHFNDVEKAIEYFIIAEGISKGTQNRYRFDSLIKKLQNKKVAN